MSASWCRSCGTYHWAGACGQPTIGDLIERSSLGTREARALRATVSDERARAIVARARQISEEER